MFGWLFSTRPLVITVQIKLPFFPFFAKGKKKNKQIFWSDGCTHHGKISIQDGNREPLYTQV